LPASGGSSKAIVAQAETDTLGLFSLGDVALDTEVSFPSLKSTGVS